MLQLVDLSLHLRSDARIGVTNRDGDDPAEKVEILFSIGIPEILHAGVIGDEGLGVIRRDGWKQVLLMFANNFFFSHQNPNN